MARPEKLPPSPISSHHHDRGYWQGVWDQWNTPPENLRIERAHRKRGEPTLESNMTSFSAFVTRRSQPSLEEMARDESRPKYTRRKASGKA